jgi:hypothetical protein
MTYLEAMEEKNIAKREVERELINHGTTLAEFLLDNDDKPFYSGYEVLVWLGY